MVNTPSLHSTSFPVPWYHPRAKSHFSHLADVAPIIILQCPPAAIYEHCSPSLSAKFPLSLLLPPPPLPIVHHPLLKTSLNLCDKKFAHIFKDLIGEVITKKIFKKIRVTDTYGKSTRKKCIKCKITLLMIWKKLPTWTRRRPSSACPSPMLPVSRQNLYIAVDHNRYTETISWTITLTPLSDTQIFVTDISPANVLSQTRIVGGLCQVDPDWGTSENSFFSLVLLLVILLFMYKNVIRGRYWSYGPTERTPRESCFFQEL